MISSRDGTAASCQVPGWVAGAVTVAAVIAGCGSPVPASGPGSASPGPGRQPPSATGTPSGLPATIRAIPFRTQSGPGILQPGTPVPAADIGPRAAATSRLIFGLADRESLRGQVYSAVSVYPAVSSDGGRRWRIDGPRFAYAAAQGPSETTSIGARALELAYAWGEFGSFVKVTDDGGSHWLAANLPPGVVSVSWSRGYLIARYRAPHPDLYVSPDQGRTWILRN